METFGLGPTADDLESLLRVAGDLEQLRLDSTSFRSPLWVDAIRGLRGRVVLTAGLTDCIRDGIDGILVPPDDPHALAEAIARLDADDALLACLAEGAREAGERLSTRA